MILRYLWMSGLGLVFLMISANSFGLMDQWIGPVWPVSKIQVFGKTQHVSQQTISAVTKKYINQSFFSFKVKALKKDLSGVPWIKSVSVRRQWPDTVRVVVREQEVLASWNGKYLINRQKELFESDELLADELVQIRGPEGMHAYLLDQSVILQRQFGQYGLRLASLTLSERRALELQLSNGVNFVFGRVHRVGESGSAISKFLTAYQHGLDAKMGRVKTVDMRYTNGFSVTWKEGRKNSNHNKIQSG